MFILLVTVINIKMTISKVLPKLILLFHKFWYHYGYWALQRAAVMNTALGLALAEPTVQRKAENDRLG